MKNSIAIIDGLFLLAALAALFILIAARKRRLRFDISFILSSLLIFNLLYGICLFLEWADITHFLEPYEDMIGAMVPMMWAFFFYAILQKITGRELKESEDRYRRLFEASNDLIIIHRLGKIIDVNQKVCDVLGYSREQLLKMSIPDLQHENTRHKATEEFQNIGKYGDKILEDTVIKANGELIHVEVSTSIIDLENGIGQMIIRDVTERKKAEDILRESEQKYRLLAEYANDIIFTLDLDLKYTYVSPSYERLRGYRPDEIVGKGIDLVLMPESRVTVQKLYNEAVSSRLIDASGNPVSRKVEIETCCKDGSSVWCEVVLSFIYGSENKPSGILGVSRDISERKKAEKDLRDSEEKFSKAFYSSPDSIIISSLETGNLIELNGGFEKMFGFTREEALNHGSVDIGIWPDKEYRGRIMSQLIEKEKVRDIEVQMIKKSGDPLTCQFSGELIEIHNEKYVLSIIKDITERKKAEKERKKLEHQLRRTQKMEAIGTLAGGIAHDFNNILSIIFGFADLARMDIDHPEKATGDLDELYKAALRAKELIKQILTISRQTEQEKQPVRISAVVNEALKLLRSTIPTSIEIKKDIISENTVFADATQIHQIILNLCTNAYHAIGDRSGVLTVSVKDALVSDDDIVIGSHIAPGMYIKIEVSDTGHGMDERTRERIFEPYFTTKKLGEGTGLGLAVVHGIVESHEGVISVYSEPGVGTSFHVYLPVFDGDDFTGDAGDQTQCNMNGKERILFIDDEKIITDIAENALSRYGYSINVFHSSMDALEEFQRAPSEYDLIITDMTMPDMTGLAVAEKIRGSYPDMPIILCSGYNMLANLQKTKDLRLEFIAKPIIISEMIKTVRHIFEKRSDDN